MTSQSERTGEVLVMLTRFERPTFRKKRETKIVCKRSDPGRFGFFSLTRSLNL